MISRLINVIKKSKREGTNYDSAAISLSKEIDGLATFPAFVEVGLDVASKIFSHVPMMNEKTASILFSMFFNKYQTKSFVLVAFVNIGAIGRKSIDIIPPLFKCAVVSEAQKSLEFAISEGEMEFDWAEGIRKEQKRAQILISRIAKLKEVLNQQRKAQKAEKGEKAEEGEKGQAGPAGQAAARSMAQSGGGSNPQRMRELKDFKSAIYRGDTRSVIAKVQNDPSLLVGRGKTGKPIFYHAINSRYLEILKIFIENGVSPNLPSLFIPFLLFMFEIQFRNIAACIRCHPCFTTNCFIPSSERRNSGPSRWFNSH
jgi:hypothetical protein